MFRKWAMSCRVKAVFSLSVIGLILFASICTSRLAYADSILTNDYTGIGVDLDNQHYETIYNPFVIYDQQQYVYKMWYAGWQNRYQDFPNDKIYYRTSSSGVTGWSNYQTVWTPFSPGMPSGGYHVNQPSVLKSWNPVTGAWQYTMFFEFAKSPQPGGAHEIWSVVSSDGVNWHTPLKLRNGGNAACDLTMVPAYDGYNIYQVLFTGSGGVNACGDGNRNKIYRVKVDGYRNPNESVGEIIYTKPSWVSGILASPHAARVNGKWQLWFNVYDGPPGNHFTDIAKAECTTVSNGELGTCSGFEWILQAPRTYAPGEPCTTATPGTVELPGNSSQYRLYQSLDYRDPDGVCRWYPQYMIHMLVQD